MPDIEQGYPGGPRPEGAHRAVMCMNCGKPEARRSLIWRINNRLEEMMNDGSLRQALAEDAQLRERLRLAIGLK